jgi:ubiquinone/menaquinone biosynthesis C-methylase UbiE
MTESAGQWGQAFERGTMSAMDAYDRIVARVFEPWARDTVERLALQEGSTVLDIACGPGTVTFLLAGAVGPTGRVIATDISPAMLAIGRSKPANGAPIEWIESPAAPLAVETDSVDAISCQQGLQFFPDKVAALKEMRRALVSGGRAVVSAWTHVEDQDFWGALHASIAAAWSTELAERYKGPFSLTGEAAADLAKEAGFKGVTLERVTLPVSLEGGAPALVESLLAAGIAADFAKLDDEGHARLLEEVTRRTKHLEREGDLYGTLTSSVLTLS